MNTALLVLLLAASPLTKIDKAVGCWIRVLADDTAKDAKPCIITQVEAGPKKNLYLQTVCYNSKVEREKAIKEFNLKMCG